MSWSEPTSSGSPRWRPTASRRAPGDATPAFEIRSDLMGRRLALFGELDIAAVAELVDTVTALEARGSGQVVLDLSHLTFIDGAGVDALLGAVRAAERAGGTLELADIPPKVARVLSITGFSTAAAG